MLRSLFVLPALCALSSGLAAQSMYVLQPGNPGSSSVRELVLSGGACAYPNLVSSSFQSKQSFGCATPAAVQPPPNGLLGDVAHDNLTDMVWATDGSVITGYTPAGVVQVSFPVPFPLNSLTGLGMDSAGGVLWMTDGLQVASVAVPSSGCPSPTISGPLFLKPAGLGLLTDIEWDPASGTLFACDTAGNVSNMTKTGVLLGSFTLSPGCSVSLPLTGIAVDTATPSPTVPFTLAVTDGFTIFRVVSGGAASLPTFYAPFTCGFPSGGPVSGLCSTLHGITYGYGGANYGGGGPLVSITGNSSTPGALTITMSGAPSGAVAWLLTGSSALCPRGSIHGGLPLWVQATSSAGPYTVSGTGTVSVPLTLPPGLAIGTSNFGQWHLYYNNPFSPGWGVSAGFEFTFGLP